MGKLCKNKFCATINTPLPFNPNNSTAKFFTPITFPPLPSFTNVSSYIPLYFGHKRYELTDWLGNVRVVVNDKKTPVNSGTTTISYKPQVVSVTDYYSFGSQISERSYDPVKPLYRFGFNTQEKTFELNKDHYTAKFWEYDSRLGRRWNVDPKPQVGWSWYVTFNNNPILHTDWLGDTVRIREGDRFIKYTAGMEYKGGDKFTGAVIGILNKISTTDAGGKLLSELGSSENNFDFTNSFAKDSKGNEIKNALSFGGYKNGGGEIKAGALLNDYMQEGQKIESAAHELFHGYQSEKGERGATINREVGAYLFGKAIAINLGYATMGFGNSTRVGQVYDKAMTGLLFSKKFNFNLYNTAIQNFKSGSIENINGLYDDFKIIPNDNNPAIKSFFPLVK